MKKINKNIAFSYDNIVKIDKYAKDNNLTFTAAINEMVNNMPYDKDAIKVIDKNIIKNVMVTNLIYKLLKQLYSDLAFPKLTDINDSKSLNDFLRKNKIDD